MKHLLFLILLGGLVGCAKKDATPTIPMIQVNTLRLTVKGEQVTIPASSAALMLSEKGAKWSLKAQSPNASINYIEVFGYSDVSSLEIPGSYSENTSPNTGVGAHSIYGYKVLADFTNSCGLKMYTGNFITYASFATTNPVFTLTIKTVDAAAHTMSGTFAGTYWKGCDKLEITDGQFNLPYTVMP